MTLQQTLLFVAAGLLLNLTPGPDVLYIVTHALRRGARAGVVAALGITAGCFVHIFAAALGVSALMAASSTAFTALKWLGAAYLVYVGLRLLSQRAQGPSAAADEATESTDLTDLAESTEAVANKSQDAVNATKLIAKEPINTVTRGLKDPQNLKNTFFQGFLTNALNPKVALFFLAFVPQFIGPEVANKPLAFLMLGLLFNMNSLAVNIGWALAAARLAPAGARPPVLAWLDRAAGVLFIGFGLKLAFSDNPVAVRP